MELVLISLMVNLLTVQNSQAFLFYLYKRAYTYFFEIFWDKLQVVRPLY
jgi:hypothetical protein